MKRHLISLLLLISGAGTLAVTAPFSNDSKIFPGAESTPRPAAPVIRLNAVAVKTPLSEKDYSFPYKDHHVSLTVLHGDPSREKEWLIQTRLDTSLSEWSTPASRRQFEFTNLPEGNYNFEARAINAAGVAGEISRLVFTIQPPWYRTNWAYTGYSVGTILVIFGFLRIRELQIRKRNQALQILVEIRTEELTKASAAKDEFLAAISHEIRNPINGIIGLTESIKIDGLDRDSRNKLGLLRQCTRHLSSLLDDILDFSRLQPDAFGLERKVFDIPELLDSVAALIAADSEKQKIPVEIAISPGVPRQLTGDPRRIRQILLNYVSNALKYSGGGKISLTVWRHKTMPDSMEIFFVVCDEGPGISLEEQTKLFTRFQRGSPTQAGQVPGSGLGLSLSKVLAEKMGGKAWVKSEAGKGSCFYLSVILGTSDKDSNGPAAVGPGKKVFRKALVIDDEEYNRIALTALIETLDIASYSAAGESEALACAKCEDLDLIFIDHSMPGLNGPAIARAIRALPGHSARALIFATTGFNTSEKQAECLAAGMDAFLPKPVTAAHLRLALGAASAKATFAPNDLRPLPDDALLNLRLLATRKGVPFANELGLYFNELDAELDQLNQALQTGDSGRASYYAHLLYGRCSFINERDLEHLLREIEAFAAWGRWDDARTAADRVSTKVSELRTRLFSENPVVQPG